jgi:hypothetical protein
MTLKITGLDTMIPSLIRGHLEGSDADEYMKTAIWFFRKHNFDMVPWLKFVEKEYPRYKEQLEKYLILL